MINIELIHNEKHVKIQMNYFDKMLAINESGIFLSFKKINDDKTIKIKLGSKLFKNST
jgi:hypothetical protein